MSGCTLSARKVISTFRIYQLAIETSRRLNNSSPKSCTNIYLDHFVSESQSHSCDGRGMEPILLLIILLKRHGMDESDPVRYQQDCGTSVQRSCPRVVSSQSFNLLQQTYYSTADLVRNITLTLQVCEPLCFNQSNLGTGNTPKNAVQTTLIGFYTDEDISNAVELLFSFAEKCSPKIDDLPQNKRGRTGESKHELDVEDLFSLYDFLNKNKIPLPTFVAANSNCLDFYQLVESISAIH